MKAKTVLRIVLVTAGLMLMIWGSAVGADQVHVDVLAPNDVDTLRTLRFTIGVELVAGNNTTFYSGPVDVRVVQGDLVRFNTTLAATNGTASSSYDVPCERFPQPIVVIAAVNVSGVVREAQRTVDVDLNLECQQRIWEADRKRGEDREDARDNGRNLLVATVLALLLVGAIFIVFRAQSDFATEEHVPSWYETIGERTGLRLAEDPLSSPKAPLPALEKRRSDLVEEARALTHRLAAVVERRKVLRKQVDLGDRLAARVASYMPKPWVRNLKRASDRVSRLDHDAVLEYERLDAWRKKTRETAKALRREIDEIRALHDLPPAGEFVADPSLLELTPLPPIPVSIPKVLSKRTRGARARGGNGG